MGRQRRGLWRTGNELRTRDRPARTIHGSRRIGDGRLHQGEYSSRPLWMLCSLISGPYNVLYRSLKPPRWETDQSRGIIRLFGNRRRFLLRSPGPRRAHSRRQRVRSGSPNSPSCLSPIWRSGRLQNTHRGTGSPTKGATGPGLAIRQRCGDRSPVRLSRDAHRGQAWANLFPRPSWRST